MLVHQIHLKNRGTQNQKLKYERTHQGNLISYNEIQWDKMTNRVHPGMANKWWRMQFVAWLLESLSWFPCHSFPWKPWDSNPRNTISWGKWALYCSIAFGEKTQKGSSDGKLPLFDDLTIGFNTEIPSLEYFRSSLTHDHKNHPL